MRVLDFFGLRDRDFCRNVLRLSLPLMLQQIITVAMFMVDNIMVGALGDAALSAVSLANQLSVIMQFLIVGLTAATSSFASQYWGLRDMANIRKTAGITLLSSEVAAVLFTLVGYCGRYAIMGMLTPDIQVQQLGVEYLEIASLIYPISVLAMSYRSILRSTENVVLPTVGGILGICLNAFLNYCMIGGNCGFPAMGVQGAALATMIGSVLEAGLQIVFAYVCKMPAADRRYPLFALDKKFCKEFFKVAAPTMLNEGVWSLSNTVIAVMYAQMGTYMSTAQSVFGTIGNISSVAFSGLGTSCMVMVAKELGRGEMDKAYRYGQRFMRLSPAIGFMMAVLIYALLPALLGMYNISDQARMVVEFRFLTYLVGSLFSASSFMAIVGIMRAGGDSAYQVLVDAGSAWVLGVGSTALLAFVLPVPPEYVCLGIIFADMGKTALGYGRFRSKKWMNNLTERT